MALPHLNLTASSPRALRGPGPVLYGGFVRRQSVRMRKTNEREVAEMLRRLLDAVDRGELTADTPAERRNLRRLEGMLAALEGTEHQRD